MQRNAIIKSGSFVVGNTQSNAVGLNGGNLIGLTVSGSVASASAISVTGSAISFLTSNDGTNYYSLYDSTGTEVVLLISTTTPRNYALNNTVFYPWNFVIAREGISASPVAQTGSNIILGFSIQAN